MSRVLILALLLAACGRGSAPAPEPTATTVPEGYEGAPDGAPGIAALLRARHTEDLPDRATLDAHPDPVASLAWLANDGATAAIKVRAVRALGTHYPPQEGALLARLATDAPAPLRAAALHALADWSVSDRSPHEAVVLGALGDADPRVALAAIAAAEGLPGARTALREAAASHPDPRVREAATLP